MVVDTRATMLCSLGTVISGSVGDDLLQDSGIIRTTGNIVIEGLISPAKYDKVELAYYRPQYGTVTTFPRALRVLRCTRDPLRGTSSVDVGCLLTLAESLQVLEVYKASDHPSSWYQQLSSDAQKLVPPTMDAQPLFEYCLGKIGVSLAAGSPSLTFKYLKSSFDLSSGVVSLISDMLKSECCIGYLNLYEQLVIKKVDLSASSGAPVLSESDIIDFQPISGGSDPPDKVTVSHNAIQASST